MKYRALSLALSSFFLISCGSDGAGPQAMSTREERRGTLATGGNNPNLIISGTSTWGRVFLDPTVQGEAEFQQQARLLLEPLYAIDDNVIVQGTDDRLFTENQKNETGVSFWGRGITLTGGFDPSRTDYPEQENIFNTEQASLRVSVVRAVPEDSSNSVYNIQEIPIHFNDGDVNIDSGQLVDSYISGNVVQMTFADEFGLISLYGQFNEEVFSGQFLFRTDKIDQDNSGNLVEVSRDPQLLGTFVVDTCGFFTCSN